MARKTKPPAPGIYTCIVPYTADGWHYFHAGDRHEADPEQPHIGGPFWVADGAPAHVVTAARNALHGGDHPAAVTHEPQPGAPSGMTLRAIRGQAPVLQAERYVYDPDTGTGRYVPE